ncbi:RES domain-containing protein (plasmid) [Rhizobium etli bv. mimosae str. IE4771]|uniref:RES domain-containing protein n=1 Tax=Rhizobium etli bv. mimosae str. IE4771 TaxID=1432050 RepID=A0A060I8L6_RHIET|nr:RES domain-containing protein [Rhizobium sp. IE4771]
MLSDRESDYEWDRDGEQTAYAIMNSADMPDAAAEDIQQILDDKFCDFDSAAMGEETEFSSDAYYEQKGTSDQAWQEEWRSFEKSLKTEARFFSRAAASHLTAIFNGIDVMRSRDGRPLVVDAGPGTGFSSVYRARAFQSGDKLEAALCRPDQHLGSPPTFLASAGRMNARGISVFYGASLDGILFPSVQAAGAVLNVVLFHKAARVEKVDVPVGTDISARSGHMEEDGWEIEYEVIERVPPTVAEEPTQRQDTSRWPNFASLAMSPWQPPDPDWRDPALRIITDSICVHIIRRVQFETDEHHVTRHRW